MEDFSKRIVFDRLLTVPDRIVLENLKEDVSRHETKAVSRVDSPLHDDKDKVKASSKSTVTSKSDEIDHYDNVRDTEDVKALYGKNNPKSETFEPTVFVSVDLPTLKLPSFVIQSLFDSYVQWARQVVRNENDVVFITHLALYFGTSVPSAICLFYDFHWWHGVAHLLMQGYYVGTYTLMMHQHIHQRGVLSKKYWLFDTIFPYITDPLMGHTWNTYFYHHVKHHHVEGNGPDDLSSTIRYQRDELTHFLHYVGRFFFLIWLDMPRYFIRKQKTNLAYKAAFFEISNYALIYSLARYVDFRAAIFVFIVPLMLMRVGLMVGNWGQHALVDEEEPDSDFRSSITLIDVPSNRFCFNDGYHTSHHLNPLRHWRDHPAAFLAQKKQYANEGALVFHDIDYIFITVRLLMKDYRYLAERLVPIGSQLDMTMEERVEFLRKKTRAFSEAQIQEKFYGSASKKVE